MSIPFIGFIYLLFISGPINVDKSCRAHRGSIAAITLHLLLFICAAGTSDPEIFSRYYLPMYTICLLMFTAIIPGKGLLDNNRVKFTHAQFTASDYEKILMQMPDMSLYSAFHYSSIQLNTFYITEFALFLFTPFIVAIMGLMFGNHSFECLCFYSTFLFAQAAVSRHHLYAIASAANDSILNSVWRNSRELQSAWLKGMRVFGNRHQCYKKNAAKILARLLCMRDKLDALRVQVPLPSSPGEKLSLSSTRLKLITEVEIFVRAYDSARLTVIRSLSRITDQCDVADVLGNFPKDSKFGLEDIEAEITGLESAVIRVEGFRRDDIPGL